MCTKICSTYCAMRYYNLYNAGNLLLASPVMISDLNTSHANKQFYYLRNKMS